MPKFPINIAQFPEEAGDPAAVANNAQVYSKDVAGITQLFCEVSDGTVYQLTPPVNAPQVDTIYYVASAPLGNDANDGLAPGTPFLTIGKAESLIPVSVEANYQIIVLDDTAPFDLPDFRRRSFVSGSIYVNSVVDLTQLGATAMNAGSAATLVVFTAVVPPEFADTYFVEILTGPAAGDIRQIGKTSAYSGTETGLVPVYPFTAVLGAGDMFRIFTPSTQLVPSTSTLSVLHGSTLGQSLTLNFERFFLNTGNVITVEGSVAFYASISNGIYLIGLATLNVELGGDVSGQAYGPSVFHTLPTSAYYGAGVTWNDNGGCVNFFGFMCARGFGGAGAIFISGECFIFGGGFTQMTAVLDGRGVFRTRVVALPFGGPGVPVFFSNDGGLAPAIWLVGTGAVFEATNLFVTIGAGTQPCVKIDAQSKMSDFGSCVGLSPGNALEVDGGFIEFVPNGVSLWATIGAAFAGLLVRWGGRANSVGISPPVSGSTPGVQDIAVGNIPDYAAAASLAATGDALLPSLTLDGSVIQRTV